MSALLEIRNISVSYGAIEALRDVTISVPQGEIIAVLGSNGGGKTTLLKKVSGLVDATAGSVSFDGEAITKLSPEVITKRGIVQAPEGRQIFGELTVAENLQIGAFTVRDATVRKRNLDRVFGYFPVLSERSEQVAQTLSGGEQQMLAISRALMARPKLLLLDEPSLGLAPLIVQQIFDIISQINRDNGTTIFLVEQNANQALKVAHRGYVMETGRITIADTGPNLLANDEIKSAYLGV